MAIKLRDNTSNNTGKGSELTYLEMDTNLESFYFSSSLDGTDLVLYTTGSDTHSIDLSTIASLGAQGTQGIAGTASAQGTDGAQGPQGTDGIDGEDGAQGTQGIAGTASAQGAQGTDGTQGIQGIQGIQGLTGTGEEGPQGPQGTTGVGEQGESGPQGIQGIQGTSGGGSGITVDNNVNNYMLTATGGSTINGEANATFTPSSGFGSQHWLDIKNGGLSFDSGLVSYGYLSSSALPHSQDTTVLTISPATYAGIFIEYQIAAFGSTAQRSGTFMAHWNSAGTVSFANYSTVDVGAISEEDTLLRAMFVNPSILIYWENPSIVVDNNHGYVATYRLLKRITIVDATLAIPGGEVGG
jgi:hypothetical protein